MKLEKRVSRFKLIPKIGFQKANLKLLKGRQQNPGIQLYDGHNAQHSAKSMRHDKNQRNMMHRQERTQSAETSTGMSGKMGHKRISKSYG